MGNLKRYNSVPVKDNCALFAPIVYFRARAIRWCHLNFSPTTPVEIATHCGTKLTITRPLEK